jgi:hypothetical protein
MSRIVIFFVNAQLVRTDVWHLRWMHLGCT